MTKSSNHQLSSTIHSFYILPPPCSMLHPSSIHQNGICRIARMTAIALPWFSIQFRGFCYLDHFPTHHHMPQRPMSVKCPWPRVTPSPYSLLQFTAGQSSLLPLLISYMLVQWRRVRSIPDYFPHSARVSQKARLRGQNYPRNQSSVSSPSPAPRDHDTIFTA